MEFFDSHNHIQFSGQNQVPAGTPKCACASTCEADWSVIERYAKETSGLLPGFGVHPWKADTVVEGWEARLEALLSKNPQAFVGEAGLDGYRAARPRGLSMEIQRKALQPQLEIARKWNRPVVLHCVKAWEPLSRFLGEAKVERFAIHRFKGSPEQAAEILRMGGYLSIHSDSIVHSETTEAIKKVPLQSLLIESDYDGPRPGSISIPEELALVIAGLSKLLGKEPHLLAKMTADNARCFYGIT